MNGANFKMARAAEVLTDALREYVRSGMGTWKTTELINPLLTELSELRNYLYEQWPMKNDGPTQSFVAEWAEARKNARIEVLKKLRDFAVVGRTLHEILSEIDSMLEKQP